MSDESIKEFLKGLATDPQMLGQFINDPDAMLGDFSGEEKAKIRAIVAHQVQRKMNEHNKPDERHRLLELPKTIRSEPIQCARIHQRGSEYATPPELY